MLRALSLPLISIKKVNVNTLMFSPNSQSVIPTVVNYER